MLVLTRRLQQSLQIGEDITVTVLEVRGDQVRLGIEAPRSTPVFRAEVLAQVRSQNAEAARASLDDARAVLDLWHPPAAP